MSIRLKVRLFTLKFINIIATDNNGQDEHFRDTHTRRDDYEVKKEVKTEIKSNKHNIISTFNHTLQNYESRRAKAL